MTGKTHSIQHNGETLEAYEVVPEGDIKGGLIVIEEVWGLTDHIKDIAERFAREGYYVVAPELLSELHIAEHAESLMLDLFNPEKRNEAQPKLREVMAPMHEPDFSGKTRSRVKEWFEYLYAKPETHQWVAVTGFCFGGSYSFALALEEPRLQIAVPFYGHADISDLNALHNIACPIRAFYGEKDENLVRDIPDIAAAMKKAGVDFDYKIYPDCGHAFFNDTNPFAYNELAARDAWTLTLQYLAEQK